ncbi:hypothetical protein GCM10011505_06710 [Tistrella bauzanensis]|uniref:Uncharacterized protein n=1 Tax=Tistrella bauzanensis TaxID=657419 RepID=A0ABQ1I9S6_9PROT|nr:hypothetical protein [Tistrella bauzanensis]GGB28106.1 hypothetical protein GCM10011505_06710 [Tistrella bauzanensis]
MTDTINSDQTQPDTARKLWHAPVLTRDDLRDAESLLDLLSGPRSLILS